MTPGCQRCGRNLTLDSTGMLVCGPGGCGYEDYGTSEPKPLRTGVRGGAYSKGVARPPGSPFQRATKYAQRDATSDSKLRERQRRKWASGLSGGEK